MPENAYPEQWDTAGLKEELKRVLGLDLPVDEWAKEEGIADEEIFTRVERRADEHMAAKVAQWGPDVIRYIEKSILLQTLDHLWREHLVMLDHLRQVIGLRGYGQRDPLNEYKAEAFSLFEAMSQSLREAVTAQLMRVEIMASPPPEQQMAPLPAMEAHKIDPTTGEDEMALALAGAETLARHGIGGSAYGGAATGGCRATRPRRRAIRKTRRVGARSAATSPALRLRQEIQALPRTLRVADDIRPDDQKTDKRPFLTATVLRLLQSAPAAVEVAGRHDGLSAVDQAAGACRRRGRIGLFCCAAGFGFAATVSAVLLAVVAGAAPRRALCGSVLRGHAAARLWPSVTARLIMGAGLGFGVSTVAVVVGRLRRDRRSRLLLLRCEQTVEEAAATFASPRSTVMRIGRGDLRRLRRGCRSEQAAEQAAGDVG